MSEVTIRPARPGTVTAVAVLCYFGAVLKLITVVAFVILAFRPGQVQRLFGAPVSDWYWIVSAVLALLLALIYAWIARRELVGDPQAWALVNVIAVINIAFAFFELASGAGWVAIAVNAVVLILNNTNASRQYFATVAGIGPKPTGGAT